MSWEDLARLGAKLKPIDEWPAKQTLVRVTGPFRAPMRDTVNELRRELEMLRAKNIVIQVAIRESDIRLDGMPRTKALANHPGVILAFDCEHGSLRLFFDAFLRWENNLRAIAEHLNHLRMASKYGVGKDGQQYQGWKQIECRKSSFNTVEEAAVFLAEWGHVSPQHVLTGRMQFQDAYRYAARRLHPDNPDGNESLFKRLQEAREVLDKHFDCLAAI